MKNLITSIAFLFLFSLVTPQLMFAGANEDLIKACQQGNLEGVKKAIAEGANVNALDINGNPVLSSSFFWPEVVKYLLENKADPNLGNTNILFQACFYSSLDVLKIILDGGADPNKPKIDDGALGARAGLVAEKAKGKAGNKYVIKAFEDMIKNAKNVETYPLATLITHTNCRACLELLLDKGAKIDIGVTDGNLIHTFAAGGATKEYRKTTNDAIKKSIEPYGLKVPDWYINLPADRDGTPEEMLKVLLSKGLNINEKNKGVAGGIPPQTPLETALGGGMGNKKEVMLALIANGADVKIKSDWYGDVILQAAQIGFPEVLQAMIEKGADINTEGKCFTDAANGALIKTFTPLSCAALKNHLAAVQFLIDKGAKTDGISGMYIQDGFSAEVKNKSAIYFAIENKNMEMVRYIAEHNGFNGQSISILPAKNIKAVSVGGGSFSPSEFAKRLNQNEIQDYLKKQGM